MSIFQSNVDVERVYFSLTWCYKSGRERAAAVAVCLLCEVYNFTNAKCINPTCHVAALFVDQMGLKDLVEAFLIHLNNMTRNVIFRKMNILEVQFEAPDILTPAILKRNRKEGVSILQNMSIMRYVLAPGNWPDSYSRLAGLAPLWKFRQDTLVQLLMCRAQH